MAETMISLLPQFWRNLFLHPFFLPVLFFILFVYKILSSQSGTTKKLPPSPRKLPIIGNLHQLGPSLHRSFQSLSQQYGKLMLLHLGNKPTLVVSSAEAVSEIMKTHDTIFANRPESRVARRLFYDYKDLAFAPYGEHWRQMKSISVLHLLSNQKVQSFRSIREDETAFLIEKIKQSINQSLNPKNGVVNHEPKAFLIEKIKGFNSSVVNLSEIIMSFTNDVICRAAIGRKYDSRNDVGFDLQELLNEAMELLGAICFGDFIPCLSWVDHLKGLHGRADKIAKELDDFLSKVIQEHQYGLSTKNDADAVCGEETKVRTFVDILLEYQKENKDAVSVDNIKAVILNMFFAGTEATYTLIEWTMCELIRHPRSMIELQEEVRKIGGPGHRISEDDLEKLRYLKAVIKEVLRLHPPGPLLLFREASQDVKVKGFDIDARTQVIINAWAIQRDPTYWEEPEEFRPERFINRTSTVNIRGGDNFQYFPFGGGRRICPGISFTTVIVELLVANLINEFDWTLPGGAECGQLDVAESVGITVHKQNPLMVVATPRT